MCFRLFRVFIYSAWNQAMRLLEDDNSISSKPKKMVSNPRWSRLSLSVKTLTYCFCFIFFSTFTNKLIKLLWLDPQSRCLTLTCSLYANLWPRYIPSKNLFWYLGKFPLGAGFIPIFLLEFYMEFSHPRFPPTSRAQSSELPSNEPRGIINAQAISRFLGLELKKGFQLRTVSTQKQDLKLLNSNNRKTHLGLPETKSKNLRK